MPIDPRFLMHKSDRVALQTLKAIPGFTPLFKAFMKMWNERMFRITNLSSHLRVGPRQLPKYYEMLLPICHKLGIEVPELYIELDVVPNAYTAGDTKPFIVLTTGLLETMPEDLIPTVIAHECGHIACHHCLYSTMGRFILSEAAALLGVDNGLVMTSIQSAFAYWMRCSEFSADRAAAICDGTSGNIERMCMHFAGVKKGVVEGVDLEVFLEQAEEYQLMIQESTADRVMEFFMLSGMDHPLNVVRAAECRKWCREERFSKVTAYLNSGKTDETEALSTFFDEIPMAEGSKYYEGKHVNTVEEELRALGLWNIEKVKTSKKSVMLKRYQVVSLTVNGIMNFDALEWLPVDSRVVIEYYDPVNLTPGVLIAPDHAWRYLNRPVQDVIMELRSAGFEQIVLEEVRKNKKGLLEREGGLARISINGQTQFKKEERFSEDAVVQITYLTFGTPEQPQLPEMSPES